MDIITKLKETATKKNLLIVGALIAVIVSSIAAGLVVQRHKRATKGSSGELPTLSYADAVRSGRISASDKEVLVVNLLYDKTKKPEFSIKNINHFTNGTPEDASTNTSDYKLEIVRGKDILHTDNFAKPQDSIAESFNENSKAISGSLTAKGGVVSKTVPWFGDDTELRITDAAGKVLISQALKDVPITNNTPDFQTVNGQDIR